jgi:hypothetical protein
MGKELFSHFKQSHVIFKEVYPTLGLCKMVYIEGKNYLIFRVAHEKTLG